MARKLEVSYVKGIGDKRISNPSAVFLSKPKTIPDCLRYWARNTPENDAVVFRSTTEARFPISWAELYERSCKMAMAFIEMVVKPGEVIAIASRTCPEWLYVVFGAMAAGITVTTIVFTYNDGSDVIEMMKKLRTCSLLVLDPGFKERNWSILKTLLDDYDSNCEVSSTRMPYLRKLIFTSQPEGIAVRTVSECLSEDYEVNLPEVDPNMAAFLFQTSGSTGVPKPVAHTHNTILKFGETLQNVSLVNGPIDFSDRPFGWVGGFPFGLMLGKTRVTLSDMCPPPEDKLSFLVDVIHSEGCTNSMILPPMIYELCRRHEEIPSDWPLRTIWTGGQPITNSITTCIGKICKCLCVVYGSTEILITNEMAIDKSDDFVDHSSGLPYRGVEVKIVDSLTGNTVPVGESGEIYIRSNQVFLEYFNDPEKTAAVKSLDGWYKTDDIGHLNSDGLLFVEGRISDVMLCGGMTVTPAILEAVLKRCPEVESAVMVPVPDEEQYQVVCACVTLSLGFETTVEQLRDYMAEVHNDKQQLFTVLPKYYLILDKFPQERTGKVSRKSLKRLAQERFCNK